MNIQNSHFQSKLLVICGPTGTGKTKLGIELAKKFNGEIVSADSRQVYKRMDIGTGKDLPNGVRIKLPWFSKIGYYELDKIKVWGYDLVSPDKEFSVSQYLRFADKVIPDIQKRGKLPIVVGGTGLYIKGVVDGIPTTAIPRNLGLRKNLENKNANDLYETLSQIDSLKAGSLNSSDKKNPRRLIRAVEIAIWTIDHSIKNTRKKENSVLFIGLKAPDDFLEDRINLRVDERINNGFEDEVKSIIKSGIEWNNQSMLSLGYRQWRDYFEGAVEREASISEWKKEERKYAKRQMTWWKPDIRINWFDIRQKGYQKNVEKFIERWYKDLIYAEKN